MRSCLLAGVVFLAGLLFGALLAVGGIWLFQATRQPTPQTELPLVDDPRLQLLVPESLLQEELAAALAGDPRLSDPVLDLQEPDIAQITVNAQMFGAPVQPVATIRFTVVDGRIEATIVALDIGELNVPQGALTEEIAMLEETVEARMNAAVGELLAAETLRLVAIKATDEHLVLELNR